MYTIDLGHKVITCNDFESMNDSDKQDVASQLVDREFGGQETHLVNYVLGKGCEDENAPFSEEEITNYDRTGVVDINGYEEELTEEEAKVRIALYEYLKDKAESLNHEFEDNEQFFNEQRIQHRLEHYNEVLSDLGDMEFDTTPEICQWWSVSSWLGDMLDRRGNCVLDGTWYGRITMNQGLCHDHNLQKIAFETYACKTEEA